MKKNFLFISIILSIFLSSCWINPQSSDYIQIDDTYYFSSYEDMRSFTIPQINELFTSWHYGKSKFDKRFKSYFDNIEPYNNSLKTMAENNFTYSVMIHKSTSTITLSDEKTKIRGNFIWITTSDEHGIIFYEKNLYTTN